MLNIIYLIFQITPEIFLNVYTNSMRRVRWYEKLGFRRFRRPPVISPYSVLPGGGNVVKINAVVARVYGLLYVEKTADGRSGKFINI